MSSLASSPRCHTAEGLLVGDAHHSKPKRLPMTKLIRFLEDDDGQALVEYALILGLIAVAALVLLTAVGQDVSDLLARVDSAMKSAVP
jgi:Flp pilus assembly pilin Flp